MTITTDLVVFGTFALVMACVLVPYFAFVVRPEQAAQAMLRHRVRTGRSAARLAPIGLLKEIEKPGVMGSLDRLLHGENRLARRLRDTVHSSGLKVTPGQVALGSLSLAVAVYALVRGRVDVTSIAVAAAVAASSLPLTLLSLLRSRRLNTLEEQFPEAVDLIARTLRAGHALTTGLRLAAEELPQPVAGEFRLLHDQQSFGLPLPDAMRAMARRVPLIDARFFVTAVLTQREAGGNLVEVLDNLSAVIRERFRIKRQLRVISAHGRLTGLVLACLPVALAAFLLARSPRHFAVLLDHPSGVPLIGAAVVLQIAGALLIYRITRVDY
jgi:tight adherence protein B